MNRGRGVAQSFNCTPAFVYVRLADALVLTFRVLQILVHLYTRRTTMTYDYLLTYLLTYLQLEKERCTMYLVRKDGDENAIILYSAAHY